MVERFETIERSQLDSFLKSKINNLLESEFRNLIKQSFPSEIAVQDMFKKYLNENFKHFSDLSSQTIESTVDKVLSPKIHSFNKRLEKMEENKVFPQEDEIKPTFSMSKSEWNFLVSKIDDFVAKSLKSKLGDSSVHTFLDAKIKDKLKSNLKPLTSEIIETLVVKLVKKHKFDLERTKDMMYSKDRIISHILSEEGVSVQNEERFIEALQTLSSSEKIKKLEVKENG